MSSNLFHVFFLAILYGMAITFNYLAVRNLHRAIRTSQHTRQNYEESRRFIEDVYSEQVTRLKARGFVRVTGDTQSPYDA